VVVGGEFRALEDLWLPGNIFIEAGTIFTGPPGWIPAVAVDPIDEVAIQAYWNLGPVTAAQSEPGVALFPLGPTSKRAGVVVEKPDVYWVRAPGHPYSDNVFILTGDGAPLGPKMAP
jgi:hypothetical protein